MQNHLVQCPGHGGGSGCCSGATFGATAAPIHWFGEAGELADC
jgi:hypothetical protein